MKPRLIHSIQKFAKLAGVEEPEILPYFNEARDYVVGQPWTLSVEEGWVGAVYPGIIGIFAFRIRPRDANAPEWHWVIVGDLPTAYVATDDARVPSEALDSYIGVMTKWADSILEGRTEDVYPVETEATVTNAKALKSRLTFLDSRVLPRVRNDEC